MLTLDTIRDGPEGAPPRPPRRRPAPGDGHRPRAPSTATTRCRRPTSTTWRRGSGAAPTASRLELYLETFDHTFGVMQERDAIVRVAAECAEDLAADGVVYAEVRYGARSCRTERGPDPRRGRRGDPRGLPDRDGAGRRGRPPDRDEAARDRDAPGGPLGRGRRVRGPLARRRASSASTSPAPRRATRRPATSTPSTASAARTSTSRSTPASRSGCRRSGRRSSSAGAERLGHGVRIVDDITVRDDGSVELGRLAAFVRDRRVPLEMCPTSNVHTGAAASIARAPDRPPPPPPLPGHGQHRQPADERRLDVVASSPRSTRRSGSASARWSG